MREVEKISEEFTKENFERLKKELRKKNAIIDMIDHNIAGGLKGSRDDEVYSFFYVNDSLPQMLGYTKEEFMAMSGGSAVGMVYPQDLEEALRQVDECFAKGLNYSAKYRIQKKDGTLLWVLDSGQKYLDENGIYKINSIITDINDMQILLQDLEIERERYRIALGNMEDTMFEYDMKEDVFCSYHIDLDRQVNEMKIENFKGYLTYLDRVPRKDLQLMEEFRQGKRNFIEIRFCKGNPACRWFCIQGTKINGSRLIGTYREVTEEKKDREELLLKAQRDSLTKVYNRGMGVKQIDIIVRNQKNGALAVLDIDDFKSANDTYGHLYGDRVLREIGRILLKLCKREEVVARIGGDEFVWYLTGNREEIEKQITAFYEELKRDHNWKREPITVSMGIATVHVKDTYESVFKRADRILYQMKNDKEKSWNFDLK